MAINLTAWNVRNTCGKCRAASWALLSPTTMNHSCKRIWWMRQSPKCSPTDNWTEDESVWAPNKNVSYKNQAPKIHRQMCTMNVFQLFLWWTVMFEIWLYPWRSIRQTFQPKLCSFVASEHSMHLKLKRKCLF